MMMVIVFGGPLAARVPQWMEKHKVEMTPRLGRSGGDSFKARDPFNLES